MPGTCTCLTSMTDPGADAGDYAGDFGLVNTWAGGLDDVLTRVPLVVRVPGGARAHVVKEQVQLLDIFPTVLELSQETPAFTKNTHFGRSLVPQLMGGAKGDPERVVYAEAGFLYPVELEPLHSGGPSMANASDPRSMEYPRRQEELEGCPPNVTLRTPRLDKTTTKNAGRRYCAHHRGATLFCPRVSTIAQNVPRIPRL